MLDSTLKTSADRSTNTAFETTQFADALSVIRELRPVNQLPPAVMSSLAELTENLIIPAQTSISSIVRDGSYVHYLVEGTLAFLDVSNSKTILSTSDSACKIAIDRRINGSVDLVAETNCFLARLPWAALENCLLEHAPGELSSSTLEVKEILASTCSDWMVRLLQSDLISMLPAANIQEVLAGVDVLQISQDEIVINQGDEPDNFYIIEAGAFSVYRDIKSSGRQIELASLSIGDFFGEEALITGNRRGTSVKATKASKLLKVNGDQFKQSIVEPTIIRQSADDAHELLSEGAIVVDVRTKEEYNAGHIPGSINLVLQLLRINSNQLEKTSKYLVVAENSNAAAVATFLLKVRGFDASCLNESIEDFAEKFQIAMEAEPDSVKSIATPKKNAAGPSEPSSKETPDETAKPTLDQISKLAAKHADRGDRPAPVEDYANTVTGVGLADLIEELNDTYETESESEPVVSPSPNNSSHLAEVQSQLSDDVDFDIDQRDTLETLDANTRTATGKNKVGQSDETITAEVARLVTLEKEKLCVEFEQKFTNKVAANKRAALQAINAHKEKLDLQFRAKQKTLLANSQKLIALANKISQQKAEVEKARKVLAAERKAV